ncbi:glutamine amidotransferase [Thiorhodospira sibirica]|uniref:glutamine amidotransferase n=1 Tax=Thiorhodospira sibirica TaxID=154347 RepID=UPI00022C5E03|nr:glutamine amidotransferase [Thiorhodospira sibirica]
MSKPLYIFKLGTTFADTAARLGDFEEWTCAAMQPLNPPLMVVDLLKGEVLPLPHECAGVILTGSHAMVTDNLPWSVALEQWLPEALALEVPVLGICYGHQLLARAMGGTVDYHPQGEEAGTVEVQLTPEAARDPLFAELPMVFKAHVSHSQTVLQLPPTAVLLAQNAHEPHHAFRLGRCAWGVQFHPEYTPAIMHDYLKAQAPALAAQGHDMLKLTAAVCATPHAQQVLQGFVQWVMDH